MQPPHEALRKVTARLNEDFDDVTLAVSIHDQEAEKIQAVEDWAALTIESMFANGEIDYPCAAFKIKVNRPTAVGYKIAVQFVRDDDQIGVSCFRESIDKLLDHYVDHNQDDGESVFGELECPQSEITQAIVDLYRQMVLVNRISVDVQNKQHKSNLVSGL